MIKTLANILKSDKEPYAIPKGVQDIIPIWTVFEDGMFRIGRRKYSKTYKFTDINFSGCSDNTKLTVFRKYSELLNGLEAGAVTKLTIINRRLDEVELEKNMLTPVKEDGLDKYREEYNKILSGHINSSTTFIQEKLITVSIYQNSPEEARSSFQRIGAELLVRFGQLGSHLTEMSLEERMCTLYSFYNTDNSKDFTFNFSDAISKGHSFKDYICPSTAEFKADYFKLGDRYGRALFLKNYASLLEDDTIDCITGRSINLMLSMDIVAIPTEEALKDIQNRLLGLETNLANWQRKQNENLNSSAAVPYDYIHHQEAFQEMLDDITVRDQKMMQCVLTLVHTADSKEQLDNDTKAIISAANERSCQFAVLNYQQLDGLNTALPIGTRKIDIFRTLTTESLAGFIPFRTQDVFQPKGFFYGENKISKNLIMADRTNLLNGNSLILGVSGGGKSFFAKWEIISSLLTTDADVLIIDPEREYQHLVNALHGQVINISGTSDTHINAMDMDKDYGDGTNPVTLKSEFIITLCDQLMGKYSLGPKQKSIIDRCCRHVYHDYQQRGYTGFVPTLKDFHKELLNQKETEAHEIALAIELFTQGSLNTFAQQTNVDTQSRLVCYDILDLGKQLMPLGMLVVLDSILNRVIANRSKGKKTFIFIDEIYLLFQNEYAANFLYTLWKRVRKYGAYATGITQNVDDMLQSHTAKGMLSNSEFLIMLNQAPMDREKLAALLDISKDQLNYITDVPAGHGLLKICNSLIPFANEFPKDSALFQLMNTKPAEK